jgi:hypothetical protein
MDTAKSEDAVVLETQYLKAVPAVGVVGYRKKYSVGKSQGLSANHILLIRKKKKFASNYSYRPVWHLAAWAGPRFTREMPRRQPHWLSVCRQHFY